MTCWSGQMPHMSEAQMRQAIAAYLGQYQQDVYARWMQSPFVHDLEWHTQAREMPPPPRPNGKRHTELQEAQPGDKVGAIDVEFRRVRS